MPTALLKACARSGCPNLTEAGLCTSCRTATPKRESAAARGYDARWRHFKVWFINQLIRLGVLPACGARWPGQPATGDSLCVKAGRIVAEHLHLDHTPPLLDAERTDSRAVCDKLRVQLLCETCHNAKTSREQGHAA